MFHDCKLPSFCPLCSAVVQQLSLQRVSNLALYLRAIVNSDPCIAGTLKPLVNMHPCIACTGKRAAVINVSHAATCRVLQCAAETDHGIACTGTPSIVKHVVCISSQKHCGTVCTTLQARSQHYRPCIIYTFSQCNKCQIDMHRGVL